MSECSLIGQPLLPLSASGVASKPLCPYMLGINSDNASGLLYKLVILPNDVHFIYCVLN